MNNQIVKAKLQMVELKRSDVECERLCGMMIGEKIDMCSISSKNNCMFIYLFG